MYILRDGDPMKFYEERWKFLFFIVLNTGIFLAGNVINKKMHGFKIYPSDISFSIILGVIYGFILAYLIIGFFRQQRETEELDFEVQGSLMQLEAFNEELIAQNDELESFARIISTKEKELREIINLSPIHIYLKNEQGKYLLCNNAHAEFLGAQPKNIEGGYQEDLEVFSKVALEQFNLNDAEVFDSNQIQKYIEKITIHNEEHYFRVNKIPVELNREEKEILVVAEEITDLVLMQEEIDEKNKKLLEDNEELVRLNNETTRLANDFEKIIRLITGVIDDETSDEVYLKNIFDLTLNLINRAHIGIIYTYKNSELRLVDSKGLSNSHLFQSLDFLSGHLPLKKNKIEYISKEINGQFRNFACIGFYYGDHQIGGMCLDPLFGEHKFLEEDIRLLESINILVNNHYMNKKMMDVQQTIQNSIIISLVKMLELFDEYTKGHSENVAELSMELAQKIGVEDTAAAYWAGMVHDIGKILVDRKVLNKKGRLTFEEYETIKMHPHWGYEVLSKSEELKDIAKYVLHHHERYDGMGYPDGLKGEEIPKISQIITVVDSFHTMRSRRAYKEPMSIVETIGELRLQKGKQFSPEIVDAFINEILHEEEYFELSAIK